MREHFREYCREFIASGQVTLDDRSYSQFVSTSSAGESIDLVISNFAPLSLVDDLPALFAKFHSIIAPGGKVLASVLNPYFAGDIRYLWFWRQVVPALWRDGQFCSPGPQGPVYRRRLAYMRARSAPHFMLTRVLPCLPIPRLPTILSAAPRRHTMPWLRMLRCRFLFLLFERTEL
jgi:SAM-dependent methyltransferase